LKKFHFKITQLFILSNIQNLNLSIKTDSWVEKECYVFLGILFALNKLKTEQMGEIRCH